MGPWNDSINYINVIIVILLGDRKLARDNLRAPALVTLGGGFFIIATPTLHQRYTLNTTTR